MSASNWLIPLVLFVVFASPMTFKAVRGVAGGWVASAEGQAKSLGLLLHGVIFVLAVGFLMKRVSHYGWSYYTKESSAHAMDSGSYTDTKEAASPMKEQMFKLTGTPY